MCIVCNQSKNINTSYPSHTFGGRIFNYLRCSSCDLVFLDPLPNTDDYAQMYSPKYIENKVDVVIHNDQTEKLHGLRFSYSENYNLITKFSSKNAQVLDYGCGNGNFISNAIHYGIQTDGIEYSRETVSKIQSELKASKIYAYDEFSNNEIEKKYDVIRLSNVLEHLYNPVQEIDKLKSILTEDGVFLVEGPLEDNFSISLLLKKIYFFVIKKIKPNRIVNSPPFHIFLSNYSSQLKMLEAANLKTEYIKVTENSWPFPDKFDFAKGINYNIKTLISHCSILCSKLISNTGNTFIYVGRI